MANLLICGAYTNTPTQATPTSLTAAQWTGFKSTLGSKLLVRRIFPKSKMPTSLTNADVNDTSALVSGAVIPFFSCKPSYTSVGSDNASIISVAQSMPNGSYLTAWHEPENDITAAQYVAMFRNFYKTAKTANPNIYIGNVYMTYQWYPGRKVPTPDAWWVGDAYTDFVFADTYMDTWQKDGAGNPVNLSADPQHMRWHNWAVTKGKPLGLAEHGVGQGFTDAQRAAYYNASETWMKANGYRMWLPWNGQGTPPGGESWDFSGGSSGSWPLTVAAAQGIVSRGQATAELNPVTSVPVTEGFVDSSSVAGNPTSSQTLVLPGGVRGGDGLYLWIAYVAVVGSTATTMTPPTGWTSAGTGSSISTGVNGVAVQLLYKTASGAAGVASTDSGATISFSVSQTCKVAAIAAAYRGMAVVPASVSFGSDPQTSSTTHGPTNAVTPAVPSYVLEFFSGRSGTTGNTSYTTPSGTTLCEAIFGTGTNPVDAVLFAPGSKVSSGGGNSTTGSQPSTYEVFGTVVLSPPVVAPTYTAPTVSGVTTVVDGTDPRTVTLTFTANDPANGTLTKHINWGDGTSVSSTTSNSITHSYASAGTFNSSVTATSSVSSLTSAAFNVTVLAVFNAGLTPKRGYPAPQTGQSVASYMKVMREVLLPAIDSDMDTALGGTTGGAIGRSQYALMRNWMAATADPANCTGTVTLAGGNVYWWQMLVSTGGQVTGVDLEVTTALSGTGTFGTLRDASGAVLATASTDTLLGTTGLRRLALQTTSVNQGDTAIFSIFVPSGVATAPAIRASNASATTVSMGTASATFRIAVALPASSDPDPLPLIGGSACPIALLALR